MLLFFRKFSGDLVWELTERQIVFRSGMATRRLSNRVIQPLDSRTEARGEPVTLVAGGETVTVRVCCRFQHPACDPMVGILIRNRIGIDVYGTNLRIEHKHLGSYQPGGELEADFHFACWLSPQQYALIVATASPTAPVTTGWMT
jgi:hypothetical protein